MIDYELIGRRVKELRNIQNVSQAQLAELIDMSVSFISHIETGKRKASLETLVRVSNALGITVDELLTGNQYNDPVEYQSDIDYILYDCNRFEKRVIYETIKAIKSSIRDNTALWERK